MNTGKIPENTRKIPGKYQKKQKNTGKIPGIREKYRGKYQKIPGKDQKIPEKTRKYRRNTGKKTSENARKIRKYLYCNGKASETLFILRR